MEKELQSKTAALEQAQRIAQVGHWDWTIKDHTLQWSDEVFRIFGFAPGHFQVTYNAFLNCVHPGDRELIEQAVNKALHKGKPYNIEHRIVLPSGSVRIVHEQGEVLLDKDGQPLRMIGTVHDITRHKQAERELEKTRRRLERQLKQQNKKLTIANQALRQQVEKRKQVEEENRRHSEFLTHVLDSIPHVFLVINANDYTIKMANSAAHARPIPPGMACYELTHGRDTPCDGQKHPCPLQEVKRTGKPVVSQHIHYDVDGKERYIEVHAYPVFDEAGSLTQIIELNVDVTERKEWEDKLAQFTQELKERNMELEQFTSTVSHDLQEPLLTIKWCIQDLMQNHGEGLDASSEESVLFMLKAAERMQEMIETLLTYSRVGTRGGGFVPCNCEKILRDVLFNMKVSITRARAKITHDSLPIIAVDPHQLAQVLQNLIANAVKFKGNAPPRIHIGAEERGEYWRFSVKDNGIGIDPEFAERIFDIFQRLHPQEKYPGTGMGLAICKKIITRHGGSMWVDSSETSGSTFYFTIPKRDYHE